ncbi:MAG: hypothetical protein DMF89_25645, partial [Acidobacteria bacterium]
MLRASRSVRFCAARPVDGLEPHAHQRPLSGPAWSGGRRRAEAEAQVGVRIRRRYVGAVQPTIVDGRVFTGSASGRVFSLSLKEGCAYWIFDADQQVRTAITVARESPTSPPVVFFADVSATVYSLDANTGQLRWKKKADDHPLARVTGTPRYANGRLYVPVSSIEEVAGADPKYSCCTFRGSVSALDASTGNQIWKRYTIGET